MIQEACAMIERVEERERRARAVKYSRRNKIRQIDRLLNELEMLNLADKTEVPERIAMELDRLLVESTLMEHIAPLHRESIGEAMDLLYEIQDSLMWNEEEEDA